MVFFYTYKNIFILKVRVFLLNDSLQVLPNQYSNNCFVTKTVQNSIVWINQNILLMNILDYFLMFRYYLYGQSEHTNTGVHIYIHSFVLLGVYSRQIAFKKWNCLVKRLAHRIVIFTAKLSFSNLSPTAVRIHTLPYCQHQYTILLFLIFATLVLVSKYLNRYYMISKD